MNKAEYQEFKRKEKQGTETGDSKDSKFSNDFKVALAAITTDEDYKALESQFFSKAGI